ncbi:MAG: hypothetical protein E7001_03565 [Coriobacteriaceae bacterium]|nr:hypothetical protein [Coriobacteriaceae bacterium]
MAARNTFEALAAGISSLHHAPSRCRVVDAEPFRSRGLRRLNACNHAIFYLVDEESETVRVVQILYGAASDERLRAPLGER